MLVVATAGHVDHGKSTLVHALTGTDPDRLAEERRRGLTIELGYAWTDDVTLVDVPGHERFLPTMLAGVGPVPAALLVVAADCGWSAQTEEHALALRLLGVRHGVVAVTRSDLADPGPVAADVRRRLRWPVVAVSGRTGAGLDDLRVALQRLAADVGPAPDADRPRLWVDRAFSLPGAGPVVTGTLGGGCLRVGDAVSVDGRAARVAGLQSRGVDVEVGEPGCRVAARLRGVRASDLHRGSALVRPDQWRPSDCLDVALAPPPAVAAFCVDHDAEWGPSDLHRTADAGDLHRMAALPERAVLHVGSAAVPVRVRPLGPGHARLALASPLPLDTADRGLLRQPGGAGLLAGIVVLDVAPPPLARRGAAAARGAQLAAGLPPSPPRLAALRPAAPDPDPLAVAEAALRDLARPFTLADARAALGTTRAEAVRTVEALDQRGRTARRPDGTRVFVR